MELLRIFLFYFRLIYEKGKLEAGGLKKSKKIAVPHSKYNQDGGFNSCPMLATTTTKRPLTKVI